MRSHLQIIDDAGGPAKTARAISADPGMVKQWKRTDSIPGPYWAAIAAASIATLDELAEAVAGRAKLIEQADAA